jgi:hypothetical protein
MTDQEMVDGLLAVQGFDHDLEEQLHRALIARIELFEPSAETLTRSYGLARFRARLHLQGEQRPARADAGGTPPRQAGAQELRADSDHDHDRRVRRLAAREATWASLERTRRSLCAQVRSPA